MSKEMIHWDRARASYKYPFDLSQFHRKNEFSSQFFNLICDGNHESTKHFEMRFQSYAPNNIEVYIEVLFWKLFSKRMRGNLVEFDSNQWYNNAINKIKKTSSPDFWNAITNFVENVKSNNIDNAKKNYRIIAGNLNINNKLIIPLTYPALGYPESIPMIDNVVIYWINRNLQKHNQNRKHKLVNFDNTTPTIENDFEKYIEWVNWCKESAVILNKISKYNDWRPRDVEMAIFSYQRQGLGESLEILE